MPTAPVTAKAINKPGPGIDPKEFRQALITLMAGYITRYGTSMKMEDHLERSRQVAEAIFGGKPSGT
jgi:hypothetical protein